MALVQPDESGGLAAALRQVLLPAADAIAMHVHGRTDAAVLVPIYVADGALHAVLTKRKADMRRHAGEISFPGGRHDATDADLPATALREASEEIGLDPVTVELVGALAPVGTFATNYAVYPFVGLTEPVSSWNVSTLEVERVLDIPLAALRDGYARRRVIRRGVPFFTHTYTVPELTAEDDLIWGATARMLGDLLRRVAPLLDAQPPH